MDAVVAGAGGHDRGDPQGPPGAVAQPDRDAVADPVPLLLVDVRLRRERPGLPLLVLSQYVQHRYAAELLDTGDGTGVGYLLKDRVGQVEEFVEALGKVADGGTVVDPEVVRQLLRRRRDPLERLTPREREVLALVAEGHSNGAVARRLVVSEAAVGKYISGILTKLDLPPADDTHRRVMAVLAYLRA
ncbi:LuxR C-terminal-related transcriptional regulator [Streptomyces sp. NPDC055952]|uniref:LuxR C-terminal-related transcriptional regulator n=1 Tax=Streptomyces sp. NPDC055952 TaxID=3345663 RepID=UPI0035D71AB4